MSVGSPESLDDLEIASDFLLSLVKSWLAGNHHIDPIYDDRSTCYKLLREEPAFYSSLKEAARAGDHSHIRDSTFLLRPNARHRREYLQRIRSEVKIYVDGCSAFEAWDLKRFEEDEDLHAHLTGLHLFGSGSEPALLVHRLGEFYAEPDIRDRIRSIFVRGKDTFLVNTSGSGKTRLTFEGLCQDWGFYFSATDNASGYAAQDMTDILETRLPREPRFVQDLSPWTDFTRRLKSSDNQQIAAHHFNAVLLARLLMFQMFVELMYETGPTPEHKLRWLLFQLRPRLVAAWDSAVHLTHILLKDDGSYLKECVTETMAKIRDIFGGEVHLFYVLDEAQAPAASFPSAFYTGGQLHPILPEILRAWQVHTVDSFEVSFVISGTRIPKEMFDYEGNKSSRHRWTSNTGGFDQSTQRRYIESFLPPSIVGSQTADRLISRAWNWMRARHRFTSGLVTMLLLNGFLPADPILDDYFRNFASIQPCDSDTDMYWITSVLKTVADGRFTTMDFSLLALHSSIKEKIRTVLFHYLMTDDHPPPFGHDGIEMVTNAFGRFIDAETNQVRVDEPLILVGAANWLLGCSKGDDPPSHTYYSILQRDPPNDNETFAKCVAYYLTLLTKKRPLREIFSFPAGSCPKWANQNARLVTLHATPTGVDVSRNFTTLATVTDSMAETVSWLQHEKPTPFCLPRTSSPDLIFILRLENGDLIWVFLRVAVTKDSYLNESVLKSMLLGLQDDNLFGEEADQQLRDNAKDALKGLPNLSSHLGRFGVLRVIASFPGPPRIGRLPTARRSHAASLNMGLFETIHQSIPAIDMVNTLAASVAGLPRAPKRKYDSDDGEQRKKAKRPRSHAPEPKKIATRSTTKKR
ncbi:hypothetical protein B0H16DRAFT_1372898 [Mycena metata]|uniref:Uncharacterized protein n=1 Tax=Mycena metata TaxID=1033252 RepID=A0AAD7J1J4_9AGAR|nr:hypothetical protein B0H16DRAFT_1372898 [Mycena metata]